MNEMLEEITRKNCGKILKRIRENFGSMSLQDFAKLIGVSRSTIMRIEDGRTLPSNEFLNRLKAIQLIGVSKFRMLSNKNKAHFTGLIEEAGENPEEISKIIEKEMHNILTPAGILAGFGVVGGASLIASSNVISSIPILSGLSGYGLLKGLKAVLKANDFRATEVDGRWEIIRKKPNGKEDKLEAISRENFRGLLAIFMEKNGLTVKKVAKAITCSVATLNRLILGKTLPSDEMLRRVGTMFGLGFDRYSKLTKAEKENISEAIGAVGGGILGFGTITGAISSLGAVSGLSAAGISTGLAALGSIVGGGMVAGVSVLATIPIGAGAIGYGIVKAVKAYCEKYQTDQDEYDPFWERPLELEE
jgi:transcriptional regulator with XRE-family HTH domain